MVSISCNRAIVDIRPLPTGRDKMEVCIQWVGTGCQSSVQLQSYREKNNKCTVEKMKSVSKAVLAVDMRSKACTAYIRIS